MRDVREFIDEICQLAQPGEVEPERDAHLELEIRHHGREVAVPNALAVSVDGALHLHRAGVHGGERIGHADAAVVVRVDADGLAERGDDIAGRALDELGQTPAIRLAEHDEIGTRVVRRLHGFQRIRRIFPVAVEKVLGVIEHLAALRLEVTHGVGDHREVFLERDLEDLGDMQRPRLADDRHRGRLRIEEHLHLRIVFDPHLAAARHAECGDLRVLPSALRRLLEECGVLRIRPRPAALDVMHAERVELLRDADLIEH